MTVAGCPTLTLLMSDSLKATVIVIFFVLTISAKPELLDEVEVEPLLVEPPRLPALVVPVLPLEPGAADELEPTTSELEEPETESPGETLSTETTVPVAGA